MKHLKLYEHSVEPQIDDWIIDEDVDLGEIINIVENEDLRFIKYYVKFPNHPNDEYFILCLSNIMHFGTKEEMEIQLQANKYNI